MMKPEILTLANAYLPTPVAPPTRIEELTKPAKTPQLAAAYALVHELLAEVARLGRSVSRQRLRYERLLDDERREQKMLLKNRDAKLKQLTEQVHQLSVDNAQLRQERDELTATKDQACQAYRSALIGLQRAFERRLESEPPLAS